MLFDFPRFDGDLAVANTGHFGGGFAAAIFWRARNVLGNALKFTPRGGQVQVTVSESATHVSVVVQDSGPGVPATLLPQLGHRFVRGDHARSGSGLGLSIAARVAELHGGALHFESGQGLTVSLVLPK